MVLTFGSASITASAKSDMKAGSEPNAGTLPQFLIPDSSANSLYSISISSSVSICSLTKLDSRYHQLISKAFLQLKICFFYFMLYMLKNHGHCFLNSKEKYNYLRIARLDYLMGTARRLSTPLWPSSMIVSSVYGFSHSTGPTRLCRSFNQFF